MLVHSYIYYKLDTNLITDHHWQALADELTRLQEARADLLGIGCYDEAFKDWDGSTGYHLPQDRWVQSKAVYLLGLRNPKPRPIKRRTLT